MGLDIVELVMAIEEAFDIRIADSEAEEVTTLGRLHSLIHAKRRTRATTDYCPSSRAFYRLRRVLAGEFGVGRQCVTARAPMDALVPREGRRQHWARLGQLLGGWEMPPLRRPEWAVWAILLSGLGVLVSAIFLAVMIDTSGPAWIPASALALWVALLGLTFPCTARFAIELPPACATVRGTVQALLRPNYGRLVSEVGGLRRDEVWGKMCDIISKQLGVDRDKLAPDTRLVDDLGAE